jgi:hypothetical protein
MLYEFKSRAAGTVVMTGPVAEQLLAIVGKAPGPRGIFTVEQMPPALAALQAAVDQETADLAAAAQTSPRSGPRVGGEASAAGGGDPEDPRQPPPVSLRQRAWPLMDLLRTAQAKGKDVTWGV